MYPLTRAINEFVRSPAQVIAALVTIGFGLSAVFKRGRRFWTNVWALVRSKPVVPSETLRIVQDFQQSRWGYGSVRGNPAMQVIFEGHVTDISGRPNRVLRAEIPNPLTVALMLLVSDNPDVRRPQVLRPHECTELHAMFFIQPVVGNEGELWQSPVIFIDQYGNRHKVENCVFKAMTAKQPPDARPPARA